MTGLHPWRVSEDLTQTARTLLPYLIEERGYVPIKVVPSRSDKTSGLQGTGEIPLGALLDLLAEGNYAGPVSREMRTTIGPLRRASASPFSRGFRCPHRLLRRSNYSADRVGPDP